MEAVNPVLVEQATPTNSIDTEDVARNLPRYVFFAGDLISPEIKRKSKALAWGGETVEPDYCTLFTTRNILFRNKITPMLRGLRWISVDMCEDDAAGVVTVRNLGGNTAPNFQNGFVAFPGSELSSLLAKKRDQGLAELTALRGFEYDRVKELRIQQHFFPEWDDYAAGRKKMPVALSWTRQQIQNGIDGTDDAVLRSVGADMLKAVDAFYYWGLDRLKIETTLVKSPPNPGTQFVFSYTDLGEQLFDILEVNRDDFLRRDTAGLLNAAQGRDDRGQIEVVNVMAEMMRQNQDLVKAALAALGKNVDVPEKETVIDTVPEQNGMTPAQARMAKARAAQAAKRAERANV